MRCLVCALAGLLGLVPVSAPAQERRPEEVGDLLMRINGPARVPAGDSASTVVVVGNDAEIAGTVREQLVVVNGTARVTGAVRGDVVVVNGRLDLGPGAQVGRNVTLYRSTLNRAPDARIGGAVERVSGISIGPIVGWLFWLSMTVALVVAGLVFAAIAGDQMMEAARLITVRPGPTILTAVIVVLGLPILAVVSFLTLVGIPVGLLLLFFVIPALWLIGYLIAGAWLGGAIVRRGVRPAPDGAGERRYLAVAIGVVLLQVIGIIPWIGALLVLAASQLGAGALAYRSWRELRHGA